MILEVSKIPYDVWYEFERIRMDYENGERFVGYHSKFYETLLHFGFIALDANDDRYNFYKATTKFGNTKDGKILEEICGKPITEIMKEKVISYEKVPDDLLSVMDALCDVDGYFNRVRLDDAEFSGIMRFHGFTEGAGPNGVDSCGTEKLKNSDDRKVIETITGLTYNEFLDAYRNSHKTKEIELMHQIALKYNYTVLKDSEYEDLCDMADRS
jgi:hypothetical protein